LDPIGVVQRWEVVMTRPAGAEAVFLPRWLGDRQWPGTQAEALDLMSSHQQPLRTPRTCSCQTVPLENSGTAVPLALLDSTAEVRITTRNGEVVCDDADVHTMHGPTEIYPVVLTEPLSSPPRVIEIGDIASVSLTTSWIGLADLLEVVSSAVVQVLHTQGQDIDLVVSTDGHDDLTISISRSDGSCFPPSRPNQ
jgi:hypothetical protein